MPHSGSLTLLAIGASAIAYLAVVRLSRWRAYNNVHNRFAHKIGSLTVAEAQEIMHLSSSWDMPLIVVYGLSFAILRTYGVPSISRILVKTGELKNAGTVAKRFLDTSIIVASWTGYPMDLSAPLTSIVAAEREREDPTTREEQDPRAFVAISRMNWLHARYPILNRDYLITLSFFITEPARWAKEYGWREFSPLEKEAFFVFYKHLGEMMKIEGIPDTLEDMMGWVEAFEQEHMVPAEVNNQMAHGMLRELTEGVPSFAKPLVGNLFICLFDERLRTAMMLPEQPPWAHALLRGTLRAFAFISRHLLLPRAKPFVIVPIARPKPQADGSLPRMRPNWDVSMPWYKPKPSALGMLLEYVKVALGLRTWDALPGPKYKQDGYRLEELGPLKFENDGHDDVMRRAAELMGCPVSGMWSRPPTSTKKEIVSTANGAHSESTL